MPGNYEIYEWHTAGKNRSKKVIHQIVHASGSTSPEINQQANGSRWNLLGTFYFTNGAAVHVSGAATATSVVVADAIKFALVSTNEPLIDNRII